MQKPPKNATQLNLSAKDKLNKTIALVGNPNCGKTTLFNRLTGSTAKVGNWSGVTVEKLAGRLKNDSSTTIVDLPGTYSLSGGSKDREVVKRYLTDSTPDVIINIVDGTNLARNLYLSGELSLLGVPFVIAINMADQLEKKGIYIDEQKLSLEFGVPVVKIVANKGINTDYLIKIALSFNKKPKLNTAFIDKDVQKRYEKLDNIVKNIIVKKRTKRLNKAINIDAIITGKYTAFLVFFIIITAVYFISIKLGNLIGSGIDIAFNHLSSNCKNTLNNVSAPIWISSLICDCLISGVGSVASFTPQILLLFCCMSILEDSGYMARIAFVFDGLFHRLGLSGKSLIPMILSCGCTVTGINATRAIEGESERKLTAFLSPFMPCSAKSAVFAWLSSIFFGGSALIASSLYFLSIFTIVVSGLILKKLKCFASSNSAFFLEIPPYRKPSFQNVINAAWLKFKEFAYKTATVIFAVSVLVWFLQSFGVTGYVGTDIENSLLYVIGSAIRYVFIPLGFGTWQASVSLVSGFMAKEAVIETLNIISADVNALFMNRYSVYSFMAFITLSPPCIASLVTARRELGEFKTFALMLIYEFVVAYLVALLINLFGFFVNQSNGLIFWIITAIMIIALGTICIVNLMRGKCYKCKKCKGEYECRK